jgi:hypothetical protein
VINGKLPLNTSISISKQKFLTRQFSESLSMKVLYVIGARKHPSNEGKVSGEGVSFARHI